MSEPILEGEYLPSDYLEGEPAEGVPLLDILTDMDW